MSHIRTAFDAYHIMLFLLFAHSFSLNGNKISYCFPQKKECQIGLERQDGE